MSKTTAWVIVGATLWSLLALPLKLDAQTSPSPCGDAELCRLIASGNLPDLRWPNFSDFTLQVTQYYAEAGGLTWFANGIATPQAGAAIALLQNAETKGLDPEDYDGSRWAARLATLSASGSAQIHDDLALTVSVMRYLSDLHFGKFDPGLFHNRPAQGQHDPREAFDLGALVRQMAQGSADAASLKSLEPPYRGYQETQEALKTYLALARAENREGTQPLPTIKRSIDPGSLYTAAPQLADILRRLGDLPANAVTPGGKYDGPLVDAVRKFQFRHGLDTDGRIGASTLRELNTPLTVRVKQLQLALERWRWAPHSFERPPIVVNIPEFELRAFNASYQTELEMKVVVGQAYHSRQTPVFAAEMTYLTFRPYWNVPLSIVRNELLPLVARDPAYLAKHNYQIVTKRDEPVSGELDGELDNDKLNALRSGALELRQLPGDENALGLVAFMFPNEHHVYMHDTPAASLFAKSRRDFSHGCIRLEKPLELAQWVLREKPEWSEERILQAMHGEQTINVPLENPIPVLIVYATAVVIRGEVHFFEDVYGQDAELLAQAAKGYPTHGLKTELNPSVPQDRRPSLNRLH